MDESHCKRRTYLNSPIEEAQCEFRFSPEMDWDPTLPGKLQLKLEDYSGYSREHRELQVQVSPEGSVGSDLQLSNPLRQVQIFTPDSQRFVGIGSNTLSIHMLRPYSRCSREGGGSWKEFRHRIQQALTSYIATVDSKREVIRIGVRYINKISVPAKIQIQEKYLNSGLRRIKGLPDYPTSISSRAEYTYPHNMRLLVSYGSVFPNSKDDAALLDLDGIWQSQQSVNAEVAMDYTDELHKTVEQAFESLITEECRSLFDAV